MIHCLDLNRRSIREMHLATIVTIHRSSLEMADADRRGWLRDDGAWIADRPINCIDEFSLEVTAATANSNIGRDKVGRFRVSRRRFVTGYAAIYPPHSRTDVGRRSTTLWRGSPPQL